VVVQEEPAITQHPQAVITDAMEQNHNVAVVLGRLKIPGPQRNTVNRTDFHALKSDRVRQNRLSHVLLLNRGYRSAVRMKRDFAK
jgi:hypothetical protein